MARVQVDRRRDLRVAHAATDHFEVDVALERECRGAVAQIVESDIRQSRVPPGAPGERLSGRALAG